MNKILVKVGISAVSAESAKNNLQNQKSHIGILCKTRNEAEASWNKEFSKIETEADEESKHIFYTALYHSCIAQISFLMLMVRTVLI